VDHSKDGVGHALRLVRRSALFLWGLVARPINFFVISVLLTMLVFRYELTGYPERHPTLNEIVEVSLIMSALYLVVAGLSAITTLVTRNARLHWLAFVGLSALLTLGFMWMGFLFSMDF
jgi:hypothetical protein